MGEDKQQLQNHRNQQVAEGMETSLTVWQYRKAGLSFAQIARQMDMSRSGVHDAFKRAVKMFRDELREEVSDHVQLQIARLEDVASFQFRVMNNVKAKPKDGEEEPPDFTPEERLTAARDIVRTSESLRKMLGLDQPEDHRFAVAVGSLEEMSGAELWKEHDAAAAPLRTMPKELQRAVIEGAVVSEESVPTTTEEVADG